MKIGSVSENIKIEKRIAITPEIAKKYKTIGFEVLLPKNYGAHLNIADEEYQNIGVKILDDEKEILRDVNVIVQLGLLSEEKNSILKEDQTLIAKKIPYLSFFMPSDLFREIKVANKKINVLS